MSRCRGKETALGTEAAPGPARGVKADVQGELVPRPFVETSSQPTDGNETQESTPCHCLFLSLFPTLHPGPQGVVGGPVLIGIPWLSSLGPIL